MTSYICAKAIKYMYLMIESENVSFIFRQTMSYSGTFVNVLILTSVCSITEGCSRPIIFIAFHRVYLVLSIKFV